MERRYRGLIKKALTPPLEWAGDTDSISSENRLKKPDRNSPVHGKPMTESNTEIDWTAQELYTLAQVADIEGRSEMSKEELKTSLESEAPHLLDPFQVVDDLESGDWVSMNHLKSRLRIDEVRNTDNFTAVIMETSRGGRHKLVCQKTTEIGKNGSSPHLERWRAGDKEWMNNSDDPVYIKKEN